MKLSQKELDTVEIDAAVFKVIRANQERGKTRSGRKAIIGMIRKELPGVPDDDIAASIERLLR